MTPIGDIEIEIVFRIAVRGRTSDLAMLLGAMNKAEAAVISIVEKPTASEEQCQNGVTTTVGNIPMTSVIGVIHGESSSE